MQRLSALDPLDFGAVLDCLVDLSPMVDPESSYPIDRALIVTELGRKGFSASYSAWSPTDREISARSIIGIALKNIRDGEGIGSDFGDRVNRWKKKKFAQNAS